MDGRACEIYGDGSQTRDFVFIDDLIAAVLKAVYAHVGGETFQIATSKERTVNEVADILKFQLQQYDIKMQIKYSQPRIGDVRRNFSDTSKAKEILVWEAKIELTEGLQQTVVWFSEQE